jgi:hypothetical protein
MDGIIKPRDIAKDIKEDGQFARRDTWGLGHLGMETVTPQLARCASMNRSMSSTM